MNEILFNKAKEKLEKEEKEAKLSNAAAVILKPTVAALLEFCRQEDEFAQAIIENDKTVAACCQEIAKKAGRAISDLEVYKQAVKFYFPGADVEFQMKIDLCASVKGNTHNDIKISLMDLM